MAFSDKEFEFLKFYMDQTWQEMRHVESLRSAVSSLIITLAALMAGFIVQQGFTTGTLIISCFIIVLGLFGAIMTRKLYEVHQADQKRLDGWYSYIQENIPNSEVIKHRDRADKIHKQKFRTLSKIPHHYFWLLLHLLISISGIIILVITIL